MYHLPSLTGSSADRRRTAGFRGGSARTSRNLAVAVPGRHTVKREMGRRGADNLGPRALLKLGEEFLGR